MSAAGGTWESALGVRRTHSHLRSIVRRPVFLAVLTVALVGLPPTVNGHGTGAQLATVTPADLGAVLLVGFAFLWVLAGADLRILRTPLMLLPVLVVAAALVTTLWSSDPLFSLVGVVRYAELFCLVPLAVVLSLRDRVDVIWLLGAVVALGVFEGAIGTYQSITKTGAGINGQTIRAIGTFGVTNQIAMATVVSSALVILLAASLRGEGRWRSWAAVLAAALVVPLLLSLSRGALLASLAGGLVVILSTGLLRAARILLLVLAFAVVGLVLTGGIGGTVAARFNTIGSTASQPDRSVQDRYDLWSTAVSIWESAPVTGVGIKQFPAYRDTHAPLALSSGSDEVGVNTYTRVELLSPHNEYLLLLSEQGVLGLGTYGLLVVVLAARHVRLLRAPWRSDVQSLLQLAGFAMLVRFAVDNIYGDLAGSTAVLYSLLLGVQLRSAVTDRSPIVNERAPADLDKARALTLGDQSQVAVDRHAAQASPSTDPLDWQPEAAQEATPDAATISRSTSAPTLVYPPRPEVRPETGPILAVALVTLLLLFALGVILVL